MNENSKPGFVSLVGAGPGDPGLITLRGSECLAKANVVVYDRLANPRLLRLAHHAELIPVGKQPDHHPVPQEQINTILVENAKLGKRVVRLKGGDPFVFGRGGEEALALKEAGIPFEIIPGVTSAIAAPAYAGIPVTHRNLAGSVALITGHRASDAQARQSSWLQYSWAADTLVFLMGMKNLPLIVEQLLASGRPAETPAALIEQGTLPDQKTVTGVLADIVDKSSHIHPPAVCVVGDVVSLRNQIGWFESLEQRPLFGLRILNTKSLPHQDQVTPRGGILPFDDFDEQVDLLGGEAIHMPVLQVVPPSQTGPLQTAVKRLAESGAYTWVVFTSANGVRFFFAQLQELRYDSRSLKGVQVAAIGPTTSLALQMHGIMPDFIPTRFTGADLGEQLPLQSGETFLLPRSEIALPDLPEILRGRGGIVDEVSVYSVSPAHPDRVVLDQLVGGQIHILTFFSPSGVLGLNKMLEINGETTPLAEILKPVTVACIGPTTEKAARALGLQVELVAQEHTGAGLIREMVKWRKRS